MAYISCNLRIPPTIQCCYNTSKQFLHNSSSNVQSLSKIDSNNVLSFTSECAPSINSLCISESVNTMLNSQCSSPSESLYVPHALTTSTNLFLNDINIWHLKLGHPNSRVLHFVLSQLGVSCSAKNFLFCEACVFGKSH